MRISPDPPRLTLCVVARDEEQALPGCLASVAGLADQLVVVDTGSVDRTIAVARELGAEVHQHTWADDFALHRNQALGYAQGEWVLVLDADERLAPQGREELPALLHAPDAADVLYLPVESTISGGAMVVSLPRLFRRRLEAEYRYPVHEQLVFPPAARVGFAALRIIHSGYASPEQNRAKALRNLALLQRMAARDEHRLRFEVRTLGTLRRGEELRQLFARYRSFHPAQSAGACSLAILADLLLEQEEEGWQLLQLARQLHPRSLDVAHAGALLSAIRFLRSLTGTIGEVPRLAATACSSRHHRAAVERFLAALGMAIVEDETERPQSAAAEAERPQPAPAETERPQPAPDEAALRGGEVVAPAAGQATPPSPALAPIPASTSALVARPDTAAPEAEQGPAGLPLVTLCMIVRDEEPRLARAIGSARPLVDQIVVVDTGSHDRTVELARTLGAEVVEQPWQDDFALHRNRSLELARGEWLLVLDGDDELQLERPAELRELLRSPAFFADVVFFIVESRQGGGLEHSPQPRLFRRSLAPRYEQPIHEQLVLPGHARQLFSDICILHHGYEEPEMRRQKNLRNLGLLQRLPRDDAHRLLFEIRTLAVLGRHEELLDALGRYLAAGEGPPAEVLRLAAHSRMALGDLAGAWALLAQGLELFPLVPDLCFAHLVYSAVRLLQLGTASSNGIPLAWLEGPLFSGSRPAAQRLLDEVGAQLTIDPAALGLSPEQPAGAARTGAGSMDLRARSESAEQRLPDGQQSGQEPRWTGEGVNHGMTPESHLRQQENVQAAVAGSVPEMVAAPSGAQGR